jgi:hypothetical protein
MQNEKKGTIYYCKTENGLVLYVFVKTKCFYPKIIVIKRQA